MGHIPAVVVNNANELFTVPYTVCARVLSYSVEIYFLFENRVPREHLAPLHSKFTVGRTTCTSSTAVQVLLRARPVLG